MPSSLPLFLKIKLRLFEAPALHSGQSPEGPSRQCTEGETGHLGGNDVLRKGRGTGDRWSWGIVPALLPTSSAVLDQSLTPESPCTHLQGGACTAHPRNVSSRGGGAGICKLQSAAQTGSS